MSCVYLTLSRVAGAAAGPRIYEEDCKEWSMEEGKPHKFNLSIKEMANRKFVQVNPTIT